MAELPSNPVPFEVLEDSTTPPRIGLELEVCSYDDPFTVLDVIPRRRELKTLDEIQGPGGGSFSVFRDDPKIIETPTLLEYRNVFRTRLDRKVVGAFIATSKRTDFVNREEKSGEYWEIAGGGLREWLHDAVVEPFGGIRSDSQASRVFSFASERGDWYVEADWVAPVSIQQYDMDPNFDPFGTAPAEWPDAPSAHWIWGVDNDAATNPAPEGINYFRYEFTIDDEIGAEQYSVFAAAKDEFDVYVDGQVIIESREANGYAKTWRADFDLSPGDHILAVRVRSTGLGAAGLIAALFRAGDAAEETSAELLAVTNITDWKVNSYPDPAPGWSPGEIMLTLLQEAGDRGVVFPTFLTPTFTSEADSDGVTWPRSLDWSFDIGTEYYDVVEKLEEVVCDLWIDPENFQLNMYVQRGVHRDVQSAAVQPVKFEIGRNVIRALEEGTSDIKNALLMSTEDGWQSVADSLTGSSAKYGRIEGYVSTGASGAVSGDLAQKIFGSRAEPEESATYEIIDLDDARPHFDFHVGDWVLAPVPEGVDLDTRRVMSISIEENEKTGLPVFAVEFDTIYQDQATRFERWLKSTGDGTLGGTLSNVSVGGGGGGGKPTTQNTQTGPMGLQGSPGPIGMTWQGDWSSVVPYITTDAVTHNGSSWIAVHSSLSVEPGTDTYYWQLIAESGGPGPAGAGLNFQGLWDSATTYEPNDLVSWDDLLWATAVENTNEEPGVSSLWQRAGVGSAGRSTASHTTSSLAEGASEQSTISLATAFRLYKIETDEPCRVRLYATAAQQAADLTRPVGADPTGDHGLIFEFVSTDSLLSAVLSPMVDGANMESTATPDIPITVANRSGVTDTIQVTFTYVGTE